MPVTGAMILGGAGLVGGVMAGNSAKSAANASAAGQVEAARIAAEAARFRPVGITTRYGGSNFQFDDKGNLINAGYNISPELRSYQDQLQGLTGRQLQQGLMAPEQYAPLQGAATGLFNLAGRYLEETPEQVAQKYMANQQNLLAPSRERQYAQLQNNLFNTGRGGLSVGGTGLRPGGGLGLSASNPEMEAYYNAMAQQDAQLAASAQEAGQRQTAFGAGLFGTGSQLLGQYQAGQTGALSPFQSSLGLGGTIEQMGQSPLDISASLAGRSATAGANVGRYLLEGGMSAAKTAQAGNAFNPLANVLQGIGTSPYAYDYLRGMGGTQSQFTPQQFQNYQAQQYGYGNTGPQGGFDFGTNTTGY